MIKAENKKLALGTAAIGRPQYINIRSQKPDAFELESFKQKGFKLLESAYNLGIRYFDTAPGYGMAEGLILDWLATKEDDSIEVATKWGYEYVANFDPNAEVHEVKDHGLAQLNKQWEVSKQLLPNLSTLQIHSATFETGVLKDTAVLGRLAEIKEAYGIRMGLSTTGDNQVDVLQKALEITVDGKRLFDVFQVTYNVLDQSLKSVLNGINPNEVRIVIKEALANGRVFPNSDYPEYTRIYDTLEGMSKKYGVGLDAIAFQFCVQSVNPFKVLSGASEELQLKANLEAENLELSEEDLEVLNSLGVEPEGYWVERKMLGWN